jgi:hypothetical protein
MTNRPKKQTTKRTPVILSIQPAPVSRGARLSRTSGPKIRTNALSTHVTNQTIIPFSRTAATGDVTVSGELIAANATFFPFLAGLATRFDKIKWHRVSLNWVPALPTTTGGTISFYFDGSRRDVGATSAAAAMQNTGCRMSQVWQTSSYSLRRSQLRSSEVFMTAAGPDAATADKGDNSFVSPGKVHIVSTALTGVTLTAATVIGYLKIDYTCELMFPSAPKAGVPSRVPLRSVPELSYCCYTAEHVRLWEHFAAGCRSPPSFYQFLALFDPFSGDLNVDLALGFEPDSLAMDLSRAPRPLRAPELLVPISGKLDRSWECSTSPSVDEY